MPEGVRQFLEGAAVAIWTTTGWTIPANQAVAVNERLQYAVVEAQACPLDVHAASMRAPQSASSLAHCSYSELLVCWPGGCFSACGALCSNLQRARLHMSKNGSD